MLVSICGFVGKCEQLQSPEPALVNVSQLELHEMLSQEQKEKQLGADRYPLLSYRGYEPLRAAVKRVYGIEWLDLEASFMANPAAVFRAMRTDQPYPVRALLNLGSNALMGYVNQQGILEGLMRQELIVVFDHWLTPTAQLADYVLPADYFLERPALMNQDGAGGAMVQQQVLQAIGKDEAWLREQLETEGISDPADVFLCLWQKNGFFVLKKTAQNPAEMQHGRHQHPAD